MRSKAVLPRFPRVALHVGLAAAILTTGLLPVVAQQVEAGSRGDVADVEEPCDGNGCDPTPGTGDPYLADPPEPCTDDNCLDDVPCVTASCPTPHPRGAGCGGAAVEPVLGPEGRIGEPCGGDADCDNGECEVPCVTASCPAFPRPTPCSAMRCYAWEPCESDGCECDGDLCEIPCDEPGECKCGDDCVPTPCELAPCDPCKHLPCRVPEIVSENKTIRWTTIFPKTVLTTDDGFELSGGVQNLLDVPLLLKIEPSVDSPTYCSIQSFSSASSNPDLRQHGYLLAPNGTDQQLPDQFDALNEDEISFTIDVAIADATGACRITLQAVVQVPGSTDVIVGEQSMSSQIEEPLSNFAHLGSMTAECRSQTIQPAPPKNQPIDVEAGTVQVTGHLHYPKHCPDNEERGTMFILYRHVNSTEPGEWTNLTSVERSSPSRGYAMAMDADVDFTKEGLYRFKVVGTYWDDWFDLRCLGALVAAGVGVLGAASGGAVGWAAATAAFGVASGLWGVLDACEPAKEDIAQYTVSVRARDRSSEPEAHLLQGLPLKSVDHPAGAPTTTGAT